MNDTMERVRLVFADRGSFHDLVIRVPSDAVSQYGRLIDALREDPRISADVYIDFRRLVAARIIDGEDA
jgi:hypothetical protein